MKHILIVDDELDLRELLEYNLKNEGFEVSTAENGSLAVEMAKQRKPDSLLVGVCAGDKAGSIYPDFD